MTATGPEQGGSSQQIEILKAEVQRQNAAQIAEEVRATRIKAQDVRRALEDAIRSTNKIPDTVEGDPADANSPKAKAPDVKKAVQKILLAAKLPDAKISTSSGKPPEATAMSTSIIKAISNSIHPEHDVSEKTAPYLHQILYKAVNGDLASVHDMSEELQSVQALTLINKELFNKIQQSFLSAAKEKSTMSEVELKRLFMIPEVRSQTTEPDPSRHLDDREWDQMYGSYFNPADRPFVESLYSPTEFVKFTEKMKDDVAAQIGQPRDSEAVARETSSQYEKKMVELFGKLYTRLDHEKPSEFFHEIEQQDVIRGILPVKNELKRRMTLLATELERAIEDGKIKDPGLYMRVEMKPDLVDIEKKTIDGQERVKPRYRLQPFAEPKKTHAHHFVHYLDQIVDQYVEARKYTHNARAIFLHPVDPEKGFYAQLAQFANDMSTVDFDQMMALPNNEVFRDAFSMYDKMVEETFASNDWRHFPSMFELKQNSLHTQVEEDVFNKLKLMYKGRHDVSEAAIEAALSMAVGASRGMFLNEIEKAAYADPHLNEDGTPTFASYYNQDASALIAFNPLHQHYRWQGTNTIDPILFMPVEGFKKDQTMVHDHTHLWKKMQSWKDSFVNGRGKTGLEGQTLFADFLVNVGNIGGPLKRKGWRTTYMLEPLYIRDESNTKFFAPDYVKTWKRFENIGYEVAQDFVGKIPAPFIGEYRGKHGGNAKTLAQKEELFGYMYKKYFDGDPAKVNDYMRGLRIEAEKEIIKKIKGGHIAPRDIKEAVEIEASNQFMYRVLARMVAQRIPTKLLRLDRDRHSADGVSRWRQIAKDMFPKDKIPPNRSQTEMFDEVMKDLLMAEQLLRKEVSVNMRKMLAEGKEVWRHGELDYKLTEGKIVDLLKGKIDDPARLEQIKDLYRRITTAYSGNEAFLDGRLARMLKSGEYKFSFALDEVDMTFIPFRGAGARVLPRAIGDISAIEKNVAAELTKLPKTLQQIAIDGKHDVAPVVEIMTKVYGALDGIIGTDYAHRVVHHIAAMTINYFKKDTHARLFNGVLGLGQLNSLAAERAGRGAAVWEWDSRQIDNFCVMLETRALLPLKPFNPTNSKPSKDPIYWNIPGISKPVRMPEEIKLFGKKIPLFQKRHPDFEWSIKNLRDEFGGNWKDKTFDTLTNFLPMVTLLLLWKYMRDALKESEGGKKK